VSHAGAALLAEAADRLGLTRALSAGLSVMRAAGRATGCTRSRARRRSSAKSYGRTPLHLAA